ncbi:MAG: response regulator [Xanthobacteraceae bacterium]
MLGFAPILIVEDEPFIALELKASIEEAGGKVVGPVGSVQAALELLQTDVVAAAVLDVQLSDGNVTPVAAALAARGIPMVFQSGVNPPPDLKRQCPDAVHYKKPVSAHLLLEKIAQLLNG